MCVFFYARAILEARAKKGRRVKVALAATPSREGVAPLRRARRLISHVMNDAHARIRIAAGPPDDRLARLRASQL